MLPGPLKDAVDVWTWKRCYSMQEVNSALSKVQLVGYSQKVVRNCEFCLFFFFCEFSTVAQVLKLIPGLYASLCQTPQFLLYETGFGT